MYRGELGHAYHAYKHLIVMSAEDVDRQTYAFVVRLWLEEHDIASGDSLWRGHITHVLSSQRAHFEDFREMVLFIEQHLQQMLDDDEISP